MTKLFWFVNICYCFLLINNNVFADIETEISTIISDSTTTDDNAKTPIFHSLNDKQGSTFMTCDTITYRSINQDNYFFLPEIVAQKSPILPLFSTLTGNHSNFIYLGGSPTDNALYLNNINMSDWFGNSNFDAFSPEFTKNMEILSGSCAAINSGKSGIVINLQPPLFNTSKPFTRLWYAQGDNKLIGVDGTFSQNFQPN